MPKRALIRNPLSWLIMAALLAAAPGCSSTERPGDGGTGGSGGAGGGTGGGDAGESCGSLIADYAAAFAAARTCNPFLTNVQCTQLASSSLQCPGCPLHVNDTTRLTAIRAAFEAHTDCLFVPCPAIACIEPRNGACVSNDSGNQAGSCVDGQ